ncbi:hypothetical protein AGMMS50267_18550 [Spirochaetia bacterium]|nr:hypothetical protein AGMMS50267_18550 [Spirochaetia bacterium]
MGYGKTAYNMRFAVRRFAPPGSVRLGACRAFPGDRHTPTKYGKKGVWEYDLWR